MPLESYVNQQELPADAVIWRFMKIPWFKDLLANEELYFCRADNFPQDPNEGIPTDEWMRESLNLQYLVLADELSLKDHKGTLAQFRQNSYINCWHHFTGEDPVMWRGFSPYGAAIVSTYGQLRAALTPLVDRLHLGLVRYNYQRGDRYNTMNFIYTKGSQFIKEDEVRIVMNWYEFGVKANRHFDEFNHAHDRPLARYKLPKYIQHGKRRRIDLKSIVNGVVVSPWASSRVFRDVQFWTKTKFKLEATRSTLKGKTLLSLKEWKAYEERELK